MLSKKKRTVANHPTFSNRILNKAKYSVLKKDRKYVFNKFPAMMPIIDKLEAIVQNSYIDNKEILRNTIFNKINKYS